jgi:hypothetical protein
MWIFMRDSFLSIVQDHSNSGRLLVRARIEGDIERIFPRARVIKLKKADYRYRAFIDRAEAARVIAAQVEAVNYPNFKNEVQLVSGIARHRAYLDVWATMRSYQDAPLL